MAWPPTIPPNTFVNLDPQQDAHPDAHNATADALAELVAAVGPIRDVYSYDQGVALGSGTQSAQSGDIGVLNSGPITIPRAAATGIIVVHWLLRLDVTTLGATTIGASRAIILGGSALTRVSGHRFVDGVNFVHGMAQAGAFADGEQVQVRVDLADSTANFVGAGSWMAWQAFGR